MVAVSVGRKSRSRSQVSIASAVAGAVITLLVLYSLKLPNAYLFHENDLRDLPGGHKEVKKRLETVGNEDEAVIEDRGDRQTLELQGQMRAAADIPADVYRPPGPMNPRASSPFLDKIPTCSSMECLKEAHLLPRGVAKYNHPHFLIIGFQKAATTSLFSYLARHNETLASYLKEPEFFVNGCKSFVPENCSTYATIRYIHRTLRSWIYLDWNGTKASFEGSTHTVRAGDLLAPRLLHMMPWVKLIVSLREPISRAASMLIHNEDKKNSGCLSRLKSMGRCLLTKSQMVSPSDGGPATYWEALEPWVNTWPSTQLLVLQYEELTSEDGEEAELMRVKQYVGVDLERPEGGLEMRNARRFKINPEGWPIKKDEYKQLIELARQDMKKTLSLLAIKSLVHDPEKWENRWEEVWRTNLDSCDDRGVCNMILS